jgi:hypothetical protein
MQHVIIRIFQEVIKHLTCFSLLHHDMLLFTPWFHEYFVNQFAHCSPGFAILHHEDMIATGYQVHDFWDWTIWVKRGLLVDEFFDNLPIGDYYGCIIESLQRVYSSILFCPSGQLKVAICVGNLMLITPYWDGWRTLDKLLCTPWCQWHTMFAIPGGRSFSRFPIFSNDQKANMTATQQENPTNPSSPGR